MRIWLQLSPAGTAENSLWGVVVLPLSATTLPGEGKKPQVPPLRCAPVGMTILLRHRLLVPLTGAKANSHNKIVIPTGAYPDFLPRSTHQQPRIRISAEKAHELRHPQSQQKIRGSVVEGPAVSFPRQEASLLIKAQIPICLVMTWQPAFVRSDSSPIFSTNYIAQPSSLPLRVS